MGKEVVWGFAFANPLCESKSKEGGPLEISLSNTLHTYVVPTKNPPSVRSYNI